MFSIIDNSQVAPIIGVCSSLLDSSCNAALDSHNSMTEVMIKQIHCKPTKDLIRDWKRKYYLKKHERFPVPLSSQVWLQFSIKFKTKRYCASCCHYRCDLSFSLISIGYKWPEIYSEQLIFMQTEIKCCGLWMKFPLKLWFWKKPTKFEHCDF